jgi:CelD/BcsL family acetyltransferase involved in cellulose biosynthesis
MNVALRLAPEHGSPEPQPPSHAGPLAHVAMFDTLADAEPYWRRLERANTVATPYQRYDFLAPWQRSVGERAGVTPAVAVGYDAQGEPLVLCPFGRRRIGAATVAEFLGGKHANFNMALWRRGVAETVGLTELRNLLTGIRGSGHGIDLLLMRNQPLAWNGVANPFALLPHQPAPSFGFRGALERDFDALMQRQISSVQRSKLRRKERNLAAHGAVRYWRVDNPADIKLVLDTFFAQKAERMRELGLADVFEASGVREFICSAASRHPDEGEPAIELYAMAVGDRIVATAGGVAADGRFCTMFNSMIRGELAQKSPGLLLLCNLVRMTCARGFHTFDLGVGEAQYKDMFCSEPEPLFDSFLPLTTLGRTLAAGARALYRVKRGVKQSTALWQAVQAIRHLRARIGSTR